MLKMKSKPLQLGCVYTRLDPFGASAKLVQRSISILKVIQGGTETVHTQHDSGEPSQSGSYPNGTEPAPIPCKHSIQIKLYQAKH